MQDKNCNLKCVSEISESLRFPIEPDVTKRISKQGNLVENNCKLFRNSVSEQIQNTKRNCEIITEHMSVISPNNACFENQSKEMYEVNALLSLMTICTCGHILKIKNDIQNKNTLQIQSLKLQVVDVTKNEEGVFGLFLNCMEELTFSYIESSMFHDLKEDLNTIANKLNNINWDATTASVILEIPIEEKLRDELIEFSMSILVLITE